MSEAKEIRPLLVAETANPEWRSVPLIGWSHSQAISKRMPSHLVTQLRNRAAIERAGLTESVDFTAINSERVNGPLWKAMSLIRGGSGKGFTTVMALTPLAQYYFEWLVWRRFKKDLLSGRFNIVHRVTPMSPAVPSPLASWCRSIGVPFVCGPLNGGLPWPAEFDAERRKEKEWMSKIRGAHRFLPAYRSTRDSSSALLIASRATFKEVPQEHLHKCFYMSENALDLSRFSRSPPPRRYSKPLQMIFVGRLVPYKGADMAIEAAASQLKSGNVELTIIGEGPEMPRLKEIAESHGIGRSVRFIGNVPHVELQDYYAKADMMLFPSIRELGGAVVIEAMALGVVPVVVDYGGPPEFLTRESGYCLKFGRREQIIKQLSDLVRSVVSNPEQLVVRSKSAYEHARNNYTWEAKAAQDEQIYRWILFDEPKPHLPPPEPSQWHGVPVPKFSNLHTKTSIKAEPVVGSANR